MLMLMLEERVFTRDEIEKLTASPTYCIPLLHYQTLQSQDPLHHLDQPAQQVMINKVAAASCMSTDFTCKLLKIFTHVRM